MRKFIPLTLIALCCYCFLQAQQSETVVIPNFGKEFVKAYQPNDLYEVEIIRADKVGYALQIASLSSYENVVRYVTELQGKWFSNVLMKLDQTSNGQPVYKILLGPFPDRQAAITYKKSMKEEGIKGFITALSTLSSNPLVKVLSSKSKETQPASASTSISTVKQAPSTKNQTGEASYYADKFHGRITASGEPFNMYAYTAAHWTLPFNTVLEVCRIDNNKCVTVKVNDRGPNPAKAIGRDGQPRILDLSLAAAEAIDLVKAGVSQVRITPVNKTPPPPIKVENPVAEEPIVKETPTYTSKGGTTTFTQNGEASYYAAKFHGRTTASGEPFDMYDYTAAHWTLPFNTLLEVCRIDNGKCVTVRVNDRGPNPAKAFGRDGKPRVIDLSLAAAKAINLVAAGVSQVRIRQVEQTPPPAIAIETSRPSTTPAPYTEKGGTGASFTQIGEASFYSDLFQNRQTASGELFDMYAYTAAHWTLPFNTKLNVCRLDNNKCVTVRVNDRGPNPQKAIGRDGRPRIIDLSLAAAQAIDLEKAGLAQVRIEIIK